MKMALHVFLISEALHEHVQGSNHSDLLNNATAYTVGCLFGLLIFSTLVDMAVTIHS